MIHVAAGNRQRRDDGVHIISLLFLLSLWLLLISSWHVGTAAAQMPATKSQVTHAHILVMSSDIYESVLIGVVGSSGRGSRPSLGNLLRNNRLLTVQGDLNHKLFQRCTNNYNNYNNAEDTFTMANCSTSISSNLKIVSMRLAANINLNKIKAVCRRIEANFDLPSVAIAGSMPGGTKRMRLKSIMIVASPRLVSTFRLLCGESLRNVPVFGVDVLKMGELFESGLLPTTTTTTTENKNMVC